ncbi:Zn-ribbon domain-containing OB-fold protein [Novosphingobium sp. TH158]|uniref:Zn-ribbon domain-containing OB-fold protein n=1 Tax=Novosphingobium sp. TH158 TaxID=2067455 RepID=UPI000C7B3B3C|nr:OB-fold domain-containing protein [Novosphingobium sp. TH158]PLK24468.1 DNA-binding protein [Novosphingobium sp. TH158]
MTETKAAPPPPKRPRPRLDAVNRPFWTGGAEGKLQIVHCPDCGQYTHPPKEFCRHCQSENVAPKAMAGTGTVDTYTINYQPWMPDLEVPFIIARVRLDDAPDVILTTNVVNCPVDAIDFDDKVRVVFEEQDGVFFPLFEKVA